MYDLHFIGDLLLIPTHAVYVFKYCMFLICHVLHGLSVNKVTRKRFLHFVYRFRVLSSSGSRDFDVQTTHQR